MLIFACRRQSCTNKSERGNRMKKRIFAIASILLILCSICPVNAANCNHDLIPGTVVQHINDVDCQHRTYAQGTCRKCNKTDAKVYYAEKGPHKYRYVKCEANTECSTPGCHAKGEYIKHTWVEATCRAPKHCTRPNCNCTEGSANPNKHTYKSKDEYIGYYPSMKQYKYKRSCKDCNYYYYYYTTKKK